MLAQQSLAHRVHDIPAMSMTPLMVTPPPQAQTISHSTSSRPARPRLSLNTHQAQPSMRLGKGSSLRLETLSAVSPTARNTFSNSYEPVRAPSVASERPTRPKLCIDSSIVSEHSQSEVTDSRTSSSSSLSSASTLDSAVSATIPYSSSQVLFGVLTNSPLQPRASLRRMMGRPRFPARKEVAFRSPLEEEIVNIRYTAASFFELDSLEQADSGSSLLLSSQVPDQDSQSNYGPREESTLSLEQPTGSPRSQSVPTISLPVRGRRMHQRKRSQTKYPKLPKAGEKRDSSSDEDSDTCPVTPVAGRRKRQREWVWTLGTLPTSEAVESASPTDTSSTSRSTALHPSSFASATLSSHNQ